MRIEGRIMRFEVERWLWIVSLLGRGEETLSVPRSFRKDYSVGTA
jgi:hypothetical protein